MMTTYVEANYRVVDSLEALPSKKLKFNVLKNGDDVLYGITSDKTSKGTSEKILLFEQKLIIADFEQFVRSEEGRQLWTLLLQNSISGHHFRTQLPPITRDIFQYTYQQLVFETLICNNLKLRFPSIMRSKEIRFSKTAFDYQNLRNALAIYVAPFEHILQLSRDYRTLSSSDGGHDDRVHGIFPLRLSDIFSLNRSTGKERKRFFLHLLYHNYRLSEFLSTPVGEVKVDIHFHVDEVIIPGVCEKWSGIFAHWRHQFLNTRSLRTSNSNNRTGNPSWEDLSVLLTFFVNKSGSKVEIDVPGGKRDIGETPLQCMHREVWEEIGFRPAEDSLPWTEWMAHNNVDKNSSSSLNGISASNGTDPKWLILQQEEDPTITSFLLCDTLFATQSLLPSFLSDAAAAAANAPINMAEMTFPYSADESSCNELVSIFSQLTVGGSNKAAAAEPTTQKENRDKKKKYKKHTGV